MPTIAPFRRDGRWNPRIGLRALLVCLPLVLPAPAPGATQQPDDTGRCAPALAVGDMGLAAGAQVRMMANGATFGFHQRVIGEETGDRSFANARFRTWVNLHDRETCRYGAYVQAEVGHVGLGAGGEFPKTDGVELRRGYLWLKPSAASLVRAGVLDWQDRFGERSTFSDPLWAVDRYDAAAAPLANSVWDFNVGGITAEMSTGSGWHYALGTLLLDQGDRTFTGDGSALLFTADVDREVGSAVWGASVYYLRDRGGYSYGDFGGPAGLAPTGESWDLWVGTRGHLTTGSAETSLYLILNTGEIETAGWDHTGWSARVATTVPAGGGAFRVQAVYATGDDGNDPTRSGEFRTIAQGIRDDAGAQSYWSPLGITAPRGPSDVNDLGIGLQNRGRGLATIQANWSRPLTPAWSAEVGAGWLRSATANPGSGSSSIGTELLAELRWQMAPLLALELGAGALAAGEFFAAAPGVSPGTLYEVYARWQMEF